jgi:hypothetical protein
LNGPDILLLERDMRLLIVLVEDLLIIEDGEEDLGVESSELEVLYEV